MVEQALKDRFKNVKFCSKRFGYVVLVGGLLAAQDFTFEYSTMFSRQKYFTEQFMEDNFGEIHREALGQDSPTPKMGYPDCGAGYYTKKLPYKAWFEV